MVLLLCASDLSNCGAGVGDGSILEQASRTLYCIVEDLDFMEWSMILP